MSPIEGPPRPGGPSCVRTPAGFRGCPGSTSAMSNGMASARRSVPTASIASTPMCRPVPTSAKSPACVRKVILLRDRMLQLRVSAYSAPGGLGRLIRPTRSPLAGAAGVRNRHVPFVHSGSERAVHAHLTAARYGCQPLLSVSFLSESRISRSNSTSSLGSFGASGLRLVTRLINLTNRKIAKAMITNCTTVLMKSP